MDKRLFLTGAAGFIGYHTALRLKKEGWEVYGYDNFNSYYDPSLKKARERCLRDAEISVCLGDLADVEKLKKEIETFHPTHILHLAAQAGVRYSLENPHSYIKSNIDGMLNILEICRNDPTRKLVYASSSSVYGLNDKIPFSENDRTDHQASLYGVTKKTNELMAETYRHLFGIKAIGLRFFTVYGSFGRPDMAYYSFTKDILEGRPIRIFNNGQMKRDFTYIDDIVEGIVSSLDYEGDTPVFNLGGHQAVELGEMISILENLLGVEARKEYLPMQQGDVVETCADIALSAKELNFFPKTDLRKGLSTFVDWYRTYYA